MSRPLANEFNGITGEYTSREMNDSEFEQYEKDIAEAEAQKTAEETAKAEAAAKREAALAKLAALGLEPDDLKALGL